MAKCFIGIGSNLGDRERNIRRAIAFLKEARIEVLKESSLIETEPVGFQKQGKFLNGVLEVSTNLEPAKLLKTFKSIEKKMGRVKTIRNGPRIIDLDILLYEDKVIRTPRLIIPHPRMLKRNFVMKPLKEIALRNSKANAFKDVMRIIVSIGEIKKFIKSARQRGRAIGFVPTMGYLHEGHLSLMRQAKKDCDICAVSIFVNPLQFGPGEDFKRYPRDIKKDEFLSKTAGVDIIFYPSVKMMYPSQHLTYVEVEKISDGLCGVSRPGHFKGVATVVTKLFNIIQPDIAYFGQKDIQQAVVIQRMVKDLNMPLKIKVMPIMRDKDGLALSSRNAYLNRQQRKDAPVLWQSLKKAGHLIKDGQRSAEEIISVIHKIIRTKKTAKIDYVECVDAINLQPLKEIRGRVIVAVAAWFGKTRLIDNIILKC